MSDYDHENQRLGACEFCRLHIICTELPLGSIKQTTRCRYIQHSTLGRGFDSPHFHNNAPPNSYRVGRFAFCRKWGESKDGGREAVLRLRRAWPSRGREHLDFYERSEVKSLVTCDRSPIVCGGIEPAGAMFREHTKLRGGVAEICE